MFIFYRRFFHQWLGSVSPPGWLLRFPSCWSTSFVLGSGYYRYSGSRLMWSRIMLSFNLYNYFPFFLQSVNQRVCLVNVFIQLMLSLYLRSQLITLSSANCNFNLIFFEEHYRNRSASFWCQAVKWKTVFESLWKVDNINHVINNNHDGWYCVKLTR